MQIRRIYAKEEVQPERHYKLQGSGNGEWSQRASGGGL